MLSRSSAQPCTARSIPSVAHALTQKRHGLLDDHDAPSTMWPIISCCPNRPPTNGRPNCSNERRISTSRMASTNRRCDCLVESLGRIFRCLDSVTPTPCHCPRRGGHGSTRSPSTSCERRPNSARTRSNWPMPPTVASRRSPRSRYPPETVATLRYLEAQLGEDHVDLRIWIEIVLSRGTGATHGPSDVTPVIESVLCRNAYRADPPRSLGLAHLSYVYSLAPDQRHRRRRGGPCRASHWRRAICSRTIAPQSSLRLGPSPRWFGPGDSKLPIVSDYRLRRRREG